MGGPGRSWREVEVEDMIKIQCIHILNFQEVKKNILKIMFAEYSMYNMMHEFIAQPQNLCSFWYRHPVFPCLGFILE